MVCSRSNSSAAGSEEATYCGELPGEIRVTPALLIGRTSTIWPRQSDLAPKDHNLAIDMAPTVT